MIKEAMKYVTELKEQAMEPKIVEINGRTYCDKELKGKPLGNTGQVYS